MTMNEPGSDEMTSSEPLSNEAIESHILAIIAKQAKLDIATIRPESTLKDLGVASLDAIEVIFDIEEAFDIEFPGQGADLDADTVQSLIDAVHSALAAKAGASAT